MICYASYILSPPFIAVILAVYDNIVTKAANNGQHTLRTFDT
jgi:hypothetical protein